MLLDAERVLEGVMEFTVVTDVQLIVRLVVVIGRLRMVVTLIK
jgi:hypothetical protein